jgi:hypothetical protein
VKPAALRQIPNLKSQIPNLIRLMKFPLYPCNAPTVIYLLSAFIWRRLLSVVRCKNFSRFPLYLGRYGDRPYNFEIRNPKFHELDTLPVKLSTVIVFVLLPA